MVIQAKITVSEPSPTRLDSISEAQRHYALYDLKSAEHRLLSTDDFNCALTRLLQLDAPVSAFLDTLNRGDAHPSTSFSGIVKVGLSFAIAAEMRARDEEVPTTVVPEDYLDLPVNAEAVLHAMTNRWQYLAMTNPREVQQPEIGDWTTHMAQFVFLTLDRAYSTVDGPPVLQD